MPTALMAAPAESPSGSLLKTSARVSLSHLFLGRPRGSLKAAFRTAPLFPSVVLNLNYVECSHAVVGGVNDLLTWYGNDARFKLTYV